MKTEHDEMLVEAKKTNQEKIESALRRATASAQVGSRAKQIEQARLAAYVAGVNRENTKKTQEATRKATAKQRQRQAQEINPETQWTDDEGVTRGSTTQQAMALARFYNVSGASTARELERKKDKTVIEEEVPANAMGTAGISGAETAVNVGIAGRDTLLSPGILRRPPPKMFGGKRVFTVPSGDYYKATLGRKKGQHWRSMVNGPLGEEIRQYALENKEAPIIVEDETTGAMMYLRYGK